MAAGFQVNGGSPALGSSHTSGTSTFSGPIALANGTNLTLTAASGGQSNFSGAITGSGGITVSGAGTTVLSSTANTYSGNTTLAQGVLVVAATGGFSATSTGTVTLSGGTLAGTTFGGTIGGTVNAGVSSHTIAAGFGLSSGHGTLTIGGDLNVNGNTTLAFNGSLFTPTGGYDSNFSPIYAGDLINVNGNLNNATTTPVISLNGFSLPSAARDYRLFSSIGQTNTFSSVNLSNFTLPTAPGGYSDSLNATLDPGYLDLVVAAAGPATWQVGSGNWSSPATNWSTGVVPNSSGGTAVLGMTATTSATVTLDIPVTLGTLVLGNSAQGPSQGYTISGSGANTLTMNNNGSPAVVSVTQGNHAINAPLTLQDSLDVTTSPTSGGTLAIGGAINDNGVGYSLELDGPGELVLSGSNNYAGGTFVNPSDGTPARCW